MPLKSTMCFFYLLLFFTLFTVWIICVSTQLPLQRRRALGENYSFYVTPHITRRQKAALKPFPGATSMQRILKDSGSEKHSASTEHSHISAHGACSMPRPNIWRETTGASTLPFFNGNLNYENKIYGKHFNALYFYS
jgi:hypothetical protein